MPLTNKEQVFKEFGAGALHSGKGGPVVKSREQAIAIAGSVERRHGRRFGKQKSGIKGRQAADALARS